jgi:hypothetical protein
LREKHDEETDLNCIQDVHKIMVRFKKITTNLINNYILQLGGAPPPIFTGMYDSYSVVFFNSAGSDVLQMETLAFSFGHPVRPI